ncbi:unnamed protein product [Protopolystoma xenopodis]|uniref:Uncharacterized protein n=1 Tax=Protopolystoma xenopodis TaxID=117903 RepID=A0A3S5C624_9PLAT|nr:unnamed protein product [Protopolystoma xenopodis]
MMHTTTYQACRPGVWPRRLRLPCLLMLVLMTFDAPGGAASWRIEERKLDYQLAENAPIGTLLGNVAVEAIGFGGLGITASDAGLIGSSPDATAYLRLQKTPTLRSVYSLGAPSSLFSLDAQSSRLTTATRIDAEYLCTVARARENRTPEPEAPGEPTLHLK